MANRFASEAELVAAFGRHVEQCPREFFAPASAGMLIIANELNLPGSGAGGSAGSADLLAVSDLGEVWLIEAKLARNPEINPHYVFANQLARYAKSLLERGLAGIHPHLQGYAFGRRTRLLPPAKLQLRWKDARTITDMLATWLPLIGKEASEAPAIISLISARISAGDFVLAVLTDEPSPTLVDWSLQNAEKFQSAVLVVERDGLTVSTRTKVPRRDANTESIAELPPFTVIPQSFKPLPATLPLVLSERAFGLYASEALPRLGDLLGNPLPARPIQSSTSFGYCIKNRMGLPIFVRVSRGDQWISEGTINAEPGEHAFSIEIILKWACDEIFLLGEDDPLRVPAAGSLYRLARDLVAGVDYALPNGTRADARRDFDRVFGDGLRARTLMLFPSSSVRNRHNFGAEDGDLEADARQIRGLFEVLLRECGDKSPVRTVKRKSRVPYGRGELLGLPTSALRLVAEKR